LAHASIQTAFPAAIAFRTFVISESEVCRAMLGNGSPVFGDNLDEQNGLFDSPFASGQIICDLAPRRSGLLKRWAFIEWLLQNRMSKTKSSFLNISTGWDMTFSVPKKRIDLL
jgi:hypothetical protein